MAKTTSWKSPDFPDYFHDQTFFISLFPGAVI